MKEGQFVALVAVIAWASWVVWIGVRSLKRQPRLKPSDIPVARLNKGPLLILFDQNLVSKSNINEAQLWMKRKGIDCLALGTFDTFQINIVDLGQVPDADINEIRRLIAEKVTVSA